jgi:hypothetical protein
MILINVTNGGLVSVSEEQGKALIATRSWKEHKPKKPTTRKPAAKQEPAEEK